MKTIEINVKNPKLAKIEDLHPIQGDLKSLSKDNFEKLKKVLIEDGFNEPITTWVNPKTKKRMVLNGHQRLRVLQLLKQDGYHIDGIPIVEIAASDEKRAVEICLTLSSQYGSVESDGLYALSEKWGIDFTFLEDKTRHVEIDLDKFKDEFFDLGEPGTENKKLSDTFLVPPFSVLDARSGYWQDRKREWLALGIESEIGRGGEQASAHKSQDKLNALWGR